MFDNIIVTFIGKSITQCELYCDKEGEKDFAVFFCFDAFKGSGQVAVSEWRSE